MNKDMYHNKNWAKLGTEDLYQKHLSYILDNYCRIEDKDGCSSIIGLETAMKGSNVPVGIGLLDAKSDGFALVQPEGVAKFLNMLLPAMKRVVLISTVWIGSGKHICRPSEDPDRKEGFQLMLFERGNGLVFTDSYCLEGDKLTSLGRTGREGVVGTGRLAPLLKVA